MKDGSISIGFSGILFIVFLILKLTNVIAWSWWWVTSPLWITIALNILIIISIVLFQFIIHRKKRNIDTIENGILKSKTVKFVKIMQILHKNMQATQQIFDIFV